MTTINANTVSVLLHCSMRHHTHDKHKQLFCVVQRPPRPRPRKAGQLLPCSTRSRASHADISNEPRDRIVFRRSNARAGTTTTVVVAAADDDRPRDTKLALDKGKTIHTSLLPSRHCSRGCRGRTLINDGIGMRFFL